MKRATLDIYSMVDVSSTAPQDMSAVKTLVIGVVATTAVGMATWIVLSRRRMLQKFAGLKSIYVKLYNLKLYEVPGTSKSEHKCNDLCIS